MWGGPDGFERWAAPSVGCHSEFGGGLVEAPGGVGVNEDDPLTFSSAFQAGAHGLVESGRFLSVAVGVLLPFLPVIALVGALVWWIRRWGSPCSQSTFAWGRR